MQRYRKVWNVRSILNYSNATLTVSNPQKLQGVAIIFNHCYQKFFLLRAFQAPLKSNIKFQGFSRTSMSCMNNELGRDFCTCCVASHNKLITHHNQQFQQTTNSSVNTKINIESRVWAWTLLFKGTIHFKFITITANNKKARRSLQCIVETN